MVKQYSAKQVVERIKKEREAGRYLYTVGVGTGISAKFSEAGGADILITYPLAKYRMRGLTSSAANLPICDSNATALELGEREVLPVCKEVPVCAGLLAIDPTRDMDRYLNKVKDVGFSGVLNCPTIGLLDGSLRTAYEESGMSFQKEIDLMEMAVKKDLYAQAFCKTPDVGIRMADVGTHMIIIHLGGTTGGTVGAKTYFSMDETAERINQFVEAVRKSYPDIIIICHGGPISAPMDFQEVVRLCPGIDGFMGGSSGERLPVELSVTETTRKFKETR